MLNFVLILICIATGMLIARRNILPKDAHKALNIWLLYVALPALALRFVPEIKWNLSALIPGLSPLVVWLGATAFVNIYAKFVSINKETKVALLITSGLGNSAFLGFPLIAAYFSEENIRNAIVYDQITFIMFSVVVVPLVLKTHAGASEKVTPKAIAKSNHTDSSESSLIPQNLSNSPRIKRDLSSFSRTPRDISNHSRIERDLSNSSRIEREISPWLLAKKLFLFPSFLATLFALIVSPFFDYSAINPLLDKLLATLSPLALFSIGLQIRFDAWKLETKNIIAGLSYKLLLAPALVLGLILLAKETTLLANVTLMEASMPAHITGSLLASQYDLNPKLCNLMVGVGILAGFVTSAMWYFIGMNLI